jgi:hypothetical protein
VACIRNSIHISNNRGHRFDTSSLTFNTILVHPLWSQPNMNYSISFLCSKNPFPMWVYYENSSYSSCIPAICLSHRHLLHFTALKVFSVWGFQPKFFLQFLYPGYMSIPLLPHAFHCLKSIFYMRFPTRILLTVLVSRLFVYPIATSCISLS